MKAWVVKQYGEPIDALARIEKEPSIPGPGELRWGA